MKARFVAIAALGGALAAATSATGADAPRRTELRVAGLERNAEIVVDRWGIPHLYASTEKDLFFVQGFNAARDRLWQLDLWRRQGEGRLAEAFGPRFVAKDRAARLFLYRGDLDKELASYHPRARQIVDAFTRGINAYVDLVTARPELLPEEFRITGARPGKWTIRTPLIRLYGLTRNAARELRFAQLVRDLGTAKTESLSTFEPPTKLDVPEGLDLSLVTDAILRDYLLAKQEVSFRAEDLAAAPAAKAADASLARTTGAYEIRLESNNWAVSGKRTTTGRPILAGDPHRALLLPSLRYVAHLSGPGWNVIGAGEPALPGISLGHNDRIAWALTIFSFPDEEDLYVYDTNPGNPRQYRYAGGWEDMQVREEEVAVRGAAPVRVFLKFTRHGPVLHEDAARHKAWALRASWLEHEGTGAYLGSLRLDQARNWEEFQRGADRHYTPSLNFAYADVDGNIGWYGAALAPIREGWTGLLPVPGDGRFEWKGWLPASHLPRRFNPPEGWIATANQFNLPEGYADGAVGNRDWGYDFDRYRRIAEVLASKSALSLEDSRNLQYDDTSLAAREIVPLLTGLSSPDPSVARALDLLRKWDFVLSKDSAAAAIWSVFVSQLRRDVWAREIPAASRNVFGPGTVTLLRRLLREPDSLFGPNPTAGRDVQLLDSLGAAVTALKAKLGPELDAWALGKIHWAGFEHPLSPAVDADRRARLNVGPLPVGGDALTPHATLFRDADGRQVYGASYRQIIDVGAWDESLVLNTPGESGDPASPHYRDLFPLATEGRFVPMLFSRGKVLEAADEILTLRPGAARR